MRVNPNFAPNILENVWQAQIQEQTALQQISTGRRVAVPSDDPSAFVGDIQNQAAQSRTDQYLQNTATLENLFQTADSALSSVVSSLNRAISLGTQGATGTLSAEDRQAIAQEAQGVMDQVLQYANTAYRGVYIFAGTASDTPPFVVDPTQASGIRYVGNSGVNNVEIAEGRSVQTNIPGSQMFQGLGADVFSNLHQLIDALQAGDTAAIGTATSGLNGSLNYVSQQRMFYGNQINLLNSNQSALQQEQVNLKSQENNLVGADFAKAASDLSQATTAHNAALAALAKVIPNSLLDYLK